MPKERTIAEVSAVETFHEPGRVTIFRGMRPIEAEKDVARVFIDLAGKRERRVAVIAAGEDRPLPPGIRVIARKATAVCDVWTGFKGTKDIICKFEPGGPIISRRRRKS